VARLLYWDELEKKEKKSYPVRCVKENNVNSTRESTSVVNSKSSQSSEGQRLPPLSRTSSAPMGVITSVPVATTVPSTPVSQKPRPFVYDNQYREWFLSKLGTPSIKDETET